MSPRPRHWTDTEREVALLPPLKIAERSIRVVATGVFCGRVMVNKIKDPNTTLAVQRELELVAL
jgi:hypothetical protein